MELVENTKTENSSVGGTNNLFIGSLKKNFWDTEYYSMNSFI